MKISRGMARQLQTWRNGVVRHGHRLGWKVGFNMAADQQRLQLPSAMVGYLSGEHRLYTDAHYRAPSGSVLLVEPEIALLIGADVPAGAGADAALASILAYTAALELVDTTRSVHDDIEEILAGNMFHAAVLLAEQRLAASAYARAQLGLSLCVNGHELGTLEQPRVPQDFAAVVRGVADMLAAQGETLAAGDWIITGAACRPVHVQVGDAVTLDMGSLGTARMEVIA